MCCCCYLRCSSSCCWCCFVDVGFVFLVLFCWCCFVCVFVVVWLLFLFSFLFWLSSCGGCVGLVVAMVVLV